MMADMAAELGPLDHDERPVRHPRRVFVRGVELIGSLGIYEHERKRSQRVVVSVDLLVDDLYDGVSDQIGAVYDYDQAIGAIRRTVEGRHYNLIETLAEDIASVCLLDPTVRQVTVTVEKPEVLATCRAVGVEIVRTR
jgi:dihydroneopterin aldolase